MRDEVDAENERLRQKWVEQSEVAIGDGDGELAGVVEQAWRDVLERIPLDVAMLVSAGFKYVPPPLILVDQPQNPGFSRFVHSEIGDRLFVGDAVTLNTTHDYDDRLLRFVLAAALAEEYVFLLTGFAAKLITREGRGFSSPDVVAQYLVLAGRHSVMAEVLPLAWGFEEQDSTPDPGADRSGIIQGSS